MEQLNRAFKILFNEGHTIRRALEKVEKEVKLNKEVSYLVNFVKNSQRGIAYSCRKSTEK
jgi:UDP-N-acetylglucosamine acyltransferase